MPIVVMKFGGSCLKDKDAFNKILNITEIYNDVKKVYVASALNGITDLLLKTSKSLENEGETDKNIAMIKKLHIDIIEQIFDDTPENYVKARDWIDDKLSELEDAFSDIKEFGLEPYYTDYIMSFGEILSTYILNLYLLSKGIDSVFIPTNKLIITDDEFNNAYPLYNLTNARVERILVPFLENQNKDIVVCLTGFIGRNKIGSITTLGRGGSDYTATIIARSLHDVGDDKNIKVILWKDVDGLLAINPKFVPESSLIKNINYKEAKHISNFGAKIIHPKCLEAIEKNKIPLEIRNFDKPLDKNFTLISEIADKNHIKGISVIEFSTIITVTSGSMVDVPGVLAKIFKVMSKNQISVSLVAQSSSEISTSFIIRTEDSRKAINALKNSDFFSEFFEINWEEVAVLSITGLKILETKTKTEIFNALEKKNINVKAISQSYNELNLSLVLEREKLVDAINTIHDHLYDEFEGID
ncbi:MAG: aspartate kinase [Candidatus Hermodarchaeota archaeon]